jgi:GABA(A) receptor-associated protein
MTSFREEHSKEQRRSEAENMLTKHPERIPLIVERATNAPKDLPAMVKVKFLVPTALTAGQFSTILQKRMELDSQKSLFIFVNGTLVPTESVMSDLYTEHKDPEDAFLYISYNVENTFGMHQ